MTMAQRRSDLKRTSDTPYLILTGESIVRVLETIYRGITLSQLTRHVLFVSHKIYYNCWKIIAWSDTDELLFNSGIVMIIFNIDPLYNYHYSSTLETWHTEEVCKGVFVCPWRRVDLTHVDCGIELESATS